MVNNDLINRSALLAEIDNERKRHIDSGNYGVEHLVVHSLRRLVEDAPAVDAVPVIRCIGCVNHNHCIAEDVFERVGIIDGYCRVGKRSEQGR